MMNLMEIMQSAQGGEAMDNLARQFGVSTQQAQAAVAAILPAMSMGLRRQADSVDQMHQFLGTLAQGRHGQAFEPQDRDGGGVADQFQKQGEDVLGMLFGSRDVSRAVASQAAQFAGLSDSVIKSMLPVIASMVMGGLTRGLQNQGYGGLLGQIASSFGGAMGGAMGGGIGGALAGAQAGQAQGSLADMLGKMMTGGMWAPQPQAGANPMGPLGDMMNSMWGGTPAKAPGSVAPTDAMTSSMKAGLDALTSMFSAGAQAQQTHVDGLNQIFSQMFGAGRPR